MLKKTVFVTSILLFSGCADIGEQLGNAVIDGITEGITAGLGGDSSTAKSTIKSKPQEPLLEDEKIWNACMDKARKEILNLKTGIFKSQLEIGARDTCQRELGGGFERGIRMQKRRNSPGREQKIEDCITRNSNLKREFLRPGMEKMCKDTVDFDPHTQCVFENKFIDLDNGKSTSSIAIEHKRCNHLKGKK